MKNNHKHLIISDFETEGVWLCSKLLFIYSTYTKRNIGESGGRMVYCCSSRLTGISGASFPLMVSSPSGHWFFLLHNCLNWSQTLWTVDSRRLRQITTTHGSVNQLLRLFIQPTKYVLTFLDKHVPRPTKANGKYQWLFFFCPMAYCLCIFAHYDGNNNDFLCIPSCPN